MANNIESKVESRLKPIIQEQGYKLYDVEFTKEGKDYYLRIFIDKDGTIDINDCERITNVINPILDKEDYIKEQYFLEVSSPGLERNLRKEEHFLAQIGNEICVRLFTAIDKQKELIGTLVEYNKEDLILEIDSKQVKIEFKNIAAAKSVYNW